MFLYLNNLIGNAMNPAAITTFSPKSSVLEDIRSSKIFIFYLIIKNPVFSSLSGNYLFLFRFRND